MSPENKERLYIAKQRARGLARFTAAQDQILPRRLGEPGPGTVYASVLIELGQGRKRNHWMWFVFPQQKGMGHSRTSKIFALSKREAKRYLKAETLGKRLLECTRIVIAHMEQGKDLHQIFGELDALKFRSCMYLFADVSSHREFHRAIELLESNYTKERGHTKVKQGIVRDR